MLSWLLCYFKSRLSHEENVFLEMIELGEFHTVSQKDSSVKGLFSLDIEKASVNIPKGETFWFHGTSWEFAKQILKNGIQIEKGTSNLDFGIKPSFYLTCDINNAYE